jgi:NADPH:quinone reductase-like Zn-dependent oxidoreductase
MREAAELLTEALGRPIAFAQTPIEPVRQYSKEMALMLEWFERVGYSADIAGLEREFGRTLTNLPDWARQHARPDGRANERACSDLRRDRMIAVRLLEYGGQLVFTDVPVPAIARDEVLVKTRSTAVNHLDLVEASGSARQILPIDLPWIPGHEFSGVVEQIGSDVAAWAEGDAVFGTTTGVGAYAEYVAVKTAAIARKPSNLSFEEAASVPVAAQTAWQGIFTHGHLEKGQTILIHGGAGAVGAYAVQLASHSGATVIATASGDDEAYLRSIGASRVIDYREEQFDKALREKVDVVFNLIRGDTQKRSFLVLKEGGHLVSATEPVSQEESAMHRVSGVMMRLAPTGELLGRIGRLLEEGSIRPDVATVYALQDVAQAWKDIARNLPGVHGMSPSEPGVTSRKPHGKVVLRVASREHEIRIRAYELFLARGAQPGGELEDWLQAERELTGE